MEVNIKAEEVWDYYKEHQAEIYEEPVLLATGNCIEVYASIEPDDEKRLTLSVCDGMEMLDIVAVDNPRDCYTEVKDFYEYYLNPTLDTINGFFESSDESDEQRVEDIEERESELDYVIDELVFTICDQTDDYQMLTAEDFDEIKDHICEYIARKFDVDIYRPMYLEGVDGDDFYTDRPYSCMVFEDADNPIYA